MEENRTIFCRKKNFHVSFLRCPLCKFFPCKQLNENEISSLHSSSLMDRKITQLKPRRTKMFILKYLDGSLKEVSNLNISNPDKKLLEGLERVYQINKEYVPKVILQPKPKKERAIISNTPATQVVKTETTEKGKKKTKKKA